MHSYLDDISAIVNVKLKNTAKDLIKYMVFVQA